MKITDYLKRQADRLEAASRSIRNFRVFDFNYIPEQPLMREEVKPVVDACLRYIKTSIANHLFLFGSRGSGKTLMLKCLQQVLGSEEDVDSKRSPKNEPDVHRK